LRVGKHCRSGAKAREIASTHDEMPRNEAPSRRADAELRRTRTAVARRQNA